MLQGWGVEGETIAPYCQPLPADVLQGGLTIHPSEDKAGRTPLMARQRRLLSLRDGSSDGTARGHGPRAVLHPLVAVLLQMVAAITAR